MGKCPNCGNTNMWRVCEKCGGGFCTVCGKDRRGVKAAFSTCPDCGKTNTLKSSKNPPNYAK